MELEEHFDILRQNALSLRKSTLKQRKHWLKSIEKWILDHRNDIQKAVFKDFKKPSSEADLTEIFPVLTELRGTVRDLKYWMRPQHVPASITYLGTRSHVHHEPKGTCLIISPWNYPFQLAIGPLVSAIAAGNAVIIKPSEFSEAVSTLIQRMITDLFEPNHVSVQLGGVEASQKLLKLPFDHIFFTGSPRVGKVVMEAASKHLTSVTLELGGKSPVIIDKSAEIKDTAEKLAWGKWVNAGQSCTAPDYVYVHEAKLAELLKHLKVYIQRLYGDQSDYCGIINQQHADRLKQWVKNAVDNGAKIELGGSIDDSLKFQPTIITNISETSTLWNEEIFGPILPIVTFGDLKEPLHHINQNEKPLALYVFAKDHKVQNRVKLETSAGSMCINDTMIQFSHPELPFGGVNNSGIGKAHGVWGFKEFSNEKSVVKQRIGLTLAKTTYPPMSWFKKLNIDFILKYL
ncbi:MAG: aldehyde dehydrogenase family protein [Cyclobacteriaceae bacterium]